MVTQQLLSSFVEIDKPQQDDRQYQLFTLGNELQVLVVSDPEAEKAAAAMDVHVGHLSDPEEVPGIAHFCEHMLFLGTEKYPDEASYKDYISEHGGRTNAFTGTENTNYFFDVAAGHLEGALDMFSQFFISPLFTPDATSRELNAVDSENSKNLQSDNFRMFQLLKHISNKDFPFHKFGTGNLKTLDTIPKERGINVRETLLDFHNRYYSANIMKLVILGKEPIETLKTWAQQKFSQVKNKNISVPHFSSKPFLREHVGKYLRVVPIKDNREIQIYWPIPPQEKLYKKLPTRYYSHLLGHEGPGSLFAYLKARGWAESLSSGEAFSGNEYSTFLVSIMLTEQGDQNVEEIMADMYRYIHMLREKGVQQRIFDECSALSEINFRFSERKSSFFYVSKLAGNMQHYEPKDVVAGVSKIREYDPELLTEFLSYLVPDNMLVFHISQQHQGSTKCNEPWYGTQYSIEDIEPSRLEELQNPPPIEDLYFPEPNPFVPKSLDIKPPPKAPQTFPQPVIKTDMLRAWFKQDIQFKVPDRKSVV